MILEKINAMRKERDLNQSRTSLGGRQDNDDISVCSNLSFKQKIILNTIEDLQRTLEYQSVELNGLHCEDNYS